MENLSFTVKKNNPNQQELEGDYIVGTVLHNRLFTGCNIEVNGKAVIVKNHNNVIEAVFSLDQYSILKYD